MTATQTQTPQATQRPRPITADPGQTSSLVAKKKPAPDWQIRTSRFCRKRPLAVAIASTVAIGSVVIFFIGRPGSTPATVDAIPVATVPPAPTNPVDDSRALAQQMIAAREQSSRTVFARMQSELGNGLSARARDYAEYARGVYQKEFDKARAENRSPIYASPEAILYGLLEQKARDLQAADAARDPVATMSALMEGLACSAAIQATVNPIESKPQPLNLTIDPNDPARMPSPILMVKALEGWRWDLQASSQAMVEAHQAAIAAQQQPAATVPAQPQVQPTSYQQPMTGGVQ